MKRRSDVSKKGESSIEENSLARPLAAVAPRKVGSNLREVSVDYLEIESQIITSRWFHGPNESDLFIWLDEKKRLIKAQTNFYGQVVEWNIIEGVRTGFVVEEDVFEENGEAKHSPKESIVFDKSPQQQAMRISEELVEVIPDLEPVLKAALAEAFRGEASLVFSRLGRPFWNGILVKWFRNLQRQIRFIFNRR